jgi:hypothetical protein
MAEYVTIELHNEFAKRLEEENTRQNHRITNLEEAVTANNKIAISVEKIAISVETMQKDLNKQGEKLEELDSRDGAKWRKVTEYVALAIIGAGLGFLLAQIGF